MFIVLRVLEQGGSCVDAVVDAVTSLEDCPYFDAGRLGLEIKVLLPNINYTSIILNSIAQCYDTERIVASSVLLHVCSFLRITFVAEQKDIDTIVDINVVLSSSTHNIVYCLKQ